MDNEFGLYADDILYDLRSTDFSNEYFNMNSIQRLKFLNEIIKVLSYYADYEVNEED